MKPTVRAVLFDWDGTLVDSCEPVFRAYERMFADYDIQFDREVYAATYSPSWHFTYRAVQLPEEHWTEADRKWLGYFDQEQLCDLIGGVKSSLERLAARNVARGLVTNGSRIRVLRELAAHGIDHHFTEIVCGDDGIRRKPDPDALLLCLERLGIPPQEAAYIGDAAEDMMMARAAGVFAIGVRGTYPNHDSLAAARPDLMADSLEHAIGHLLDD